MKLLTLLTPLAALFLAGSIQPQASGTLYTRIDSGVVRAAIRIELEGDWHIYHRELGHPKAVGQATQIQLLGEGIEWSEPRFPEPVRLDQSDVAGPGVFILAHEHELVVYAAGRLGPGASGQDVRAKVKGLVCEDIQGCIPYRQELSSKGAGPDTLFVAFPADLVAPGAGSVPGASQAPTAQEALEEVPEDEIEGGEADATLYTRRVGEEVRAAVQIEITPGWHLYHTPDDLGFNPSGGPPSGKPTLLELQGGGVTWEAPHFPAPEREDQSDFNGAGAYINAHSGTIVVYVRGRLDAGADGRGISGHIEGQTCKDVCLNYAETIHDQGPGPDAVWAGWEQALGGPTGAAAVGDSTDTPGGPTGAGTPEPEEKSLLAFLLLAVGGGLFALVMPCTYPMIPITISFFTKQAEKRGGTPLSLSLAYGAGIVLIFILIGVVFGSLIIPFATHPVTNLVIGAAFVYFALVLFGVVNLQPPRFLMNAAGTASSKGGLLGVFLMGATLVVTSFTCTAPFVGSLLAVGASDGNLGRIALGMGVFGLTLAVPFVFLSLIPGRLRAMPRSGEWMNTMKVFMGFVELAAALKFLSNADLVWNWQLLSREVFLLLWGLIFLGAALYLLGVFSRGPRPGGRRLASGAATVLLALYCFWGMSGKKLDFVMTAIAPNYSGGLVGWNWYETGGSWPIVKDDYAAALERARTENKLLLGNFTGFT